MSALINPCPRDRETSNDSDSAVDRVRVRSDGTSLHASVLCAPIVSTSGPVASYAIYRDITELKQAEQVLRAERGRLLELFQQAPAFVAVLSGGAPCNFDNCDVNGDGAIDFGDINPFVDVLVNGNAPTGTWLGSGHSCAECP